MNNKNSKTDLDWIFPKFCFSNRFRLAFLSACVIGIITHIYIFTNLLLNHDSVWRLCYDNENLHLGRWALKFFSDFSTQFQMPVVICFIALFMLSLSSGLTVNILDVKNKSCVVLISAFLVTFPSVACIFSYMFTADAYFIALFLNVLAVYIGKQYHSGWIISICLCALACGIYQAFICYAIGLFLLDCIIKLFSEEKIKEIIKAAAKYIVIIIGSLIFYYLILKILLKIEGESLADYQGFSSIDIFNIKGFLLQIPLVYKNFIKYFFTSFYLTKFYQVVLYCILFSFAGLLFYMGVIY